jgi:anti-anti-sigma factor
MHEQFEMRVDRVAGSAPVVRLKGRLDAAGAQELRGQCLDLREQGEARIVLKLAEVTFVASSGLGTFLLLTEEFGNAGGRIVLAEPSESVMRVVQLLNLDKFLQIAESLEEARATVGV